MLQTEYFFDLLQAEAVGLKGGNFQMIFLRLCRGLHGKLELVLSDLEICKKINFCTHKLSRDGAHEVPPGCAADATVSR